MVPATPPKDVQMENLRFQDPTSDNHCCGNRECQTQGQTWVYCYLFCLSYCDTDAQFKRGAKLLCERKAQGRCRVFFWALVLSISSGTLLSYTECKSYETCK